GERADDCSCKPPSHHTLFHRKILTRNIKSLCQGGTFYQLVLPKSDSRPQVVWPFRPKTSPRFCSPYESRSGRKNARSSTASASGCSMAAKWPPRGITVQRRMSE